MPAFIPPMNATLVAAPFDNPEWLFEVKWDGFRVEAIVDDDEVRPMTRGGLDAGRYFGSFLEPPTWIEARQAIVDGEVIAVDEAGEPDFARLQSGIKGRSGAAVARHPFLYVVFDLLFIDGRSLLAEPLEDRRRLLAEALRRIPVSDSASTSSAMACPPSLRPRSAASRGSWRRTDDPSTNPACAR